MKSKPPSDRAASVRQRLLNLAKERGEDFNFILLRYGLERLLFRLGQSRYASTFVLKGAMLFPLWSGSPHRATKDMDLLGSGVGSPHFAVAERGVPRPRMAGTQLFTRRSLAETNCA